MKRAILVAAFIGSVGVMAGCGGDDSTSPVVAAPSPTSVSSATRTVLPTSTPTPPSQALADLVIDGAGNVATPIPGCARDQSEYPAVHLLVCVRNRGNADAPPFDVNATGILHFGALAAGARACLTTAPPTFGGVNIRVDYGHVVTESDELNNEVDVVVGVFTPPPLCTTTETPGAPSATPTPTRTHATGAVCYEQVDCEPQLFATSLGQQACCELARRSGSLPFSWCPAGAVSEATGRCTACLAHPCIGIATWTPSPTPTPTPPDFGKTNGLCYRAATTCEAILGSTEPLEVGQPECCQLWNTTHHLMSWCAPSDLEEGECVDCKEPCEGLITPTPIPT